MKKFILVGMIISILTLGIHQLTIASHDNYHSVLTYSSTAHNGTWQSTSNTNFGEYTLWQQVRNVNSNAGDWIDNMIYVLNESSDIGHVMVTIGYNSSKFSQFRPVNSSMYHPPSQIFVDRQGTTNYYHVSAVFEDIPINTWAYVDFQFNRVSGARTTWSDTRIRSGATGNYFWAHGLFCPKIPGDTSQCASGFNARYTNPSSGDLYIY